MVQAFPDGKEEESSTGQFVFGGVLASTGLTLGINNGVSNAASTTANEESNASGSLAKPEDGIAKFMKQFFQEQDAK